MYNCIHYSKEKSNKREKTKKHMCATCGKTFQFHGNLKAHERIHSGDKPFKCTTCNQRYILNTVKIK